MKNEEEKNSFFSTGPTSIIFTSNERGIFHGNKCEKISPKFQLYRKIWPLKVNHVNKSKFYRFSKIRGFHELLFYCYEYIITNLRFQLFLRHSWIKVISNEKF